MTSELFADGGRGARGRARSILYGAGQRRAATCAACSPMTASASCAFSTAAPRAGDEYRGVPIVRRTPAPSTPAAAPRRPGRAEHLQSRRRHSAARARRCARMGFSQVVSFPSSCTPCFREQLGDRFWLTDRGFLDVASPPTSRRSIGSGPTTTSRARVSQPHRSASARRVRRQSASRGPTADPLLSRGRPWLAGPAPDALRRLRRVSWGHAAADARSSGCRLEASAHFEPDLDNFAGLARLRPRRRHAISADRLSCGRAPSAIARRPSHFSEGAEEASGVSADRRDDCRRRWRSTTCWWAGDPTLIKMDIEGSELEALHGDAAAPSPSGRPALAVCVYHRPDHLWRIPLLLAQLAERERLSILPAGARVQRLRHRPLCRSRGPDEVRS